MLRRTKLGLIRRGGLITLSGFYRRMLVMILLNLICIARLVPRCLRIRLTRCILVNTTDHTGGLYDGHHVCVSGVPPQRATITGMGVYVETAGVGTWTICKVGLYSAAGTRLAVSTNDTSLYKSTGVTEKAFSSTYDAERASTM